MRLRALPLGLLLAGCLAAGPSPAATSYAIQDGSTVYKATVDSNGNLHIQAVVVAGGVADGGITTLGTISDTPWSQTGTATAISALKEAVLLLNSISTAVQSAYSSTAVSGSVTTGGTFQQVLAANTSRHGCNIQNTSSAVEYFYLGASGQTEAGSIQVQPGQTFSCTNFLVTATDEVQVTGGTTGQTFAGFYQ